MIYVDPKSGGFGLKLHLEIRTHWLSRVLTHPGGAVVNIQVPSTRGCGFLLEQPLAVLLLYLLRVKVKHTAACHANIVPSTAFLLSLSLCTEMVQKLYRSHPPHIITCTEVIIYRYGPTPSIWDGAVTWVRHSTFHKHVSMATWSWNHL